MKINCERHLIRFIPHTFFLFITLLLVGCEKDTVNDDTPNKILGTWHLVSQSTDGASMPIDSTRMLIQINSDKICILCDSTKASVLAKKIVKRSGWSYSGGLLNLAIDLPVSWTPTIESNLLTLKKIEFSPSGTIKNTIQVFNRVDNIVIK